MSKWRAEVIKLFPEYSNGIGGSKIHQISLYEVFFELLKDLDGKIAIKNTEWLEKVFTLIEWCFQQGSRNKDIRNAAAVAFLEHMADSDTRAELIPALVKPWVFELMWGEFKKRRERKGEGKANELLEAYNLKRGTAFQY